MKRIKKWLNENNLSYEQVTLTDGESALMVATDYGGPHPSKEALKKQALIRNKIRRFKTLTAEPRGHKTAVLIKKAS